VFTHVTRNTPFISVCQRRTSFLAIATDATHSADQTTQQLNTNIFQHSCLNNRVTQGSVGLDTMNDVFSLTISTQHTVRNIQRIYHTLTI